MRDRFTHSSRLGRGKIPREIRFQVYERDEYTCQFCGKRFEVEHLTIDHLIPIAGGGLDEVTNYVTSCRPCNEEKAALPLVQFAVRIKVQIEALPVHGDPVIDNDSLPLQIRLLRKRIFDKVRAGELRAAGKTAQKKIEKEYRREFWNTELGKSLEAEFPSLPGQCRIMIPEIKTIAKTAQEFLLLLELAKSARTRNLIGSVLTSDCDVIRRTEALIARPSTDAALKKRLQDAYSRFKREANRHGLSVVAQLSKGG